MHTYLVLAAVLSLDSDSSQGRFTATDPFSGNITKHGTITLSLMTDLEPAVSHGDSLYTRAMSKGYKPELRLLFFLKIYFYF